jgi:NADPH:quinone reductase-like Zn-dependent oxidoreductase
MWCAYAASVGGDDPISNLAVGELPDRQAGPNEAVVAVETGSLNHHDLWTLKGVASRPVVPPQVLGCDAAGVVTGYGGSDQPLPIGSRVVVHSVLGCGKCDRCGEGLTHLCRRVGILSEPGYPGALTNRLVVPVQNLIALPETVSFETAACLPTAYVTAHHALFTRAQCKSRDTVLIHGASGGFAIAAMQLCKVAGINVFVTSRSAVKGQAAVDRGLASRSFTTDSADAKEIVSATDGNGVDAVLDSVGAATWDLSLRSLRTGGTLVSVGATSGPNPPAQLNRIFWRHLTIAGSSMGTKEELQTLVEMCATQRLEPLVDQVFELSETPQALRKLAEGNALGKLVIRLR